MFTILDYSSALEYSIIRCYTNIVYCIVKLREVVRIPLIKELCRWIHNRIHDEDILYRLTKHEAQLDDRETTIAILNSQNAVVYEEITGLLRTCPLPEPNS